MKKLLAVILLLSGVTFAALDTDADGVSDDKDVCPRVYARSTNGCPTLGSIQNPPVSLNSCLVAQIKSGKAVLSVVPVCDNVSGICPKVSNILGVQSCDPIFPVIFDAETGFVLVRGSIYIVDYTK